MVEKLATEQGKAFALEALRKRREENKDQKRSSHPGDADCYCIACGGTTPIIGLYYKRSKLCKECGALNYLGWLE